MQFSLTYLQDEGWQATLYFGEIGTPTYQEHQKMGLAPSDVEAAKAARLVIDTYNHLPQLS